MTFEWRARDSLKDGWQIHPFSTLALQLLNTLLSIPTGSVHRLPTSHLCTYLRLPIESALNCTAWKAAELPNMAPILEEEEAALDPYTLLGLDKTAAGGGITEKMIKKAYRTMSLKYHPDKVCQSPPPRPSIFRQYKS